MGIRRAVGKPKRKWTVEEYPEIDDLGYHYRITEMTVHGQKVDVKQYAPGQAVTTTLGMQKLIEAQVEEAKAKNSKAWKIQKALTYSPEEERSLADAEEDGN